MISALNAQKTTFISSLFVLVILAYGCAVNSKPLKFTRLDKFSNGNPKFDSLSVPGHYSEAFIISNWKDNKDCTQQLNEFVLHRIDSNVYRYMDYSIAFFLESKITNVEHLTSNPRDLDRDSDEDDRKFKYTWFKGQFIGAYEVRNGKLVGGENIIISEAPPLKTSNK